MPKDVPRRLHSAVSIAMWLLLGLLLFRFAYDVWLLRLPQFAFRALFYYDYALVVLGIGAIGAIAIWRSRPSRFRFTLRQILALVALVSFLVGADQIARRESPLRYCFQASESDLDRLADQLLRNSDGKKVQLNASAGYYHIVSGQASNGTVILRLDESAHTFYGFIRAPEQTLDHRDGPRLSLDRSGFAHLSGDWFVFYSHYHSIKTGWS